MEALARDAQTWLYPAIEPYRKGRLKVSDIHEIYFEESGNPQGKPAVFVHGGPGGGSGPQQRRFFDPRRYRIILFDQRGCGLSTPHACVEQNTTWDLVSDMERIREELKIERWQVFGGSWGSTLALAYAQKHPARVTELILRGIFLLRQSEIDWFYQNGADQLLPDLWEEYVNFIPAAERSNFVAAYHKRLMSSDPKVQLAAAKKWSIWEGSSSRLLFDADTAQHYGTDDFALAFARIENHYFYNKGFFEVDGQLLRDIGKIRHIPAVIVQGRYDVVCPMRSAWDLHRAWPEAELFVIPDAGHSAFEPGISRALAAAADKFSK
ncbi:prolyl aminopeptidase [bacterium]|nr:prolyl aminopeptidase [bacterium]